MKKIKKSNRGITLIALVITIIILLILAGLSISSLTGSGLFKKAEDAKILSELGKVNEAIELYKLNEMMKNQYEECTDRDLAKNANLAKRIIVNDTSRNVLILKDLKEIDTSSSLGKGYKQMSLDTIENINKITDVSDVYVKDLTDGTLYYIENGNIGV